MRLRTLAGAYAGQIREYDIVAGRQALRTGMAEPVDQRTSPTSAPPVVTEATNPRPQPPARTRRRGQ